MSESTKFLFLTAAYAVFWLGTFAYVYLMQRRQGALEKELEALQGLLESRGPDAALDSQS
jgi:CcmD family protein